MLQKSIVNTVTLKGIGLHSGIITTLRLHPAEVNTGIRFIRSDLSPTTIINGVYDNVENTTLATQIIKDGISIKTVEHLYSALAGLKIDNMIIELNGPEIPIMDGSSSPFVFAIRSAGIHVQNAHRIYVKIKKEITVKENDKYATLRPYDGTRAIFEIDYNNKFVDSTPQRATFDADKESYVHSLSRARTFGFEKDVNFLRESNCILGGSLDNSILVGDNDVVNEYGLRLNDEFVRHKLLDAIGDLYLLNHQILGEYHGYKSGHTLNNKLLRALMSDKDAWEYVV